jgi:hypothetical protein
MRGENVEFLDHTSTLMGVYLWTLLISSREHTIRSHGHGAAVLSSFVSSLVSPLCQYFDLQEHGRILVGYRIWMAYLAKFVYQESKTFLVHISNNAQSVGLVYLQLRRDKTARGRVSAAF